MEADRFARSAQTFGIKLKSNLQGFGKGGRAEKNITRAPHRLQTCVSVSLAHLGGGKKRINFTPLAPRDAASVYSFVHSQAWDYDIRHFRAKFPVMPYFHCSSACIIPCWSGGWRKNHPVFLLKNAWRKIATANDERHGSLRRWRERDEYIFSELNEPRSQRRSISGGRSEYVFQDLAHFFHV